MKTGLNDYFSVTRLGSMQLTGGSTGLLANELRMLVLLSKPARLRDIVGLVPGADGEAVLGIANNMRRSGLITVCDAPPEDDGVIEFTPASDALAANAVQRVFAAAEADAARCELTRRGFYVSIARRAAKQLPPLNGRAYSILVIEDDAILVRMYGKLLSGMGFGVANAGNRFEIEEALNAQTRPDLVLLDLNLPDIGGLDILHRLSSHPQLGSTPVIVASFDTTKESIIRSLALGADGYITKPIAVDSLTDSIRAVLGFVQIDRSKEGAWASVVA